MRPYKITYWKNKVGQIKERGFQNGVIRQFLVGEPDPYYVENTLIPAQKATEQEEAGIQKKLRIQRKMREMAEKELEKEGKL